jgi:murein DD-endopeptidase MepM/ murein hydrolase activator NlpD/flagellar motor protein MotB
MKRINSRFRIFFVAVALLFLINFSFLVIAEYNAYYQNTRTTASTYDYSDLFSEGSCRGANDLVIQILPGACSPTLVRSDLLEENDVPVFCQLTAVKYNPLIDLKEISYISPKILKKSSDTVMNVRYYPARAAVQSSDGTLLSNPFVNNIGYLVLILKKQPNEQKMPESVSADIELSMNYKSGNSFGYAKTTMYLKEFTSDTEWKLNSKSYGFWKGMGFVKAESIGKDAQGEYVNIGIYKDAENKMSDITLRAGATQKEVYLPAVNGNSCPPTAIFNLQSLDYPKTKALLKINDEEIWVREGDIILDGKCSINKIDADYGKVTLSCPKKIELQLSPPNVDLSFDNAGQTIDGKYKVGDELVAKTGIYLAYVGDTSKANAKLQSTAPNKDFIVLMDTSKANMAISPNEDFFKTISLFVERDMNQKELSGSTMQIAKNFLKNFIGLITPQPIAGTNKLVSATQNRVEYLDELKTALYNDFNRKFEFEIITLADEKTFGSLKNIKYKNKNAIEDRKFSEKLSDENKKVSEQLGDLLEYYYQNAFENYKDVQNNYGLEDYNSEIKLADSSNSDLSRKDNIFGKIKNVNSAKKFGEIALIRIADLSSYVLKKLSSQKLYYELISSFGSTNSAIKADAESGLSELNRDLSKSSKIITLSEEEYKFVLQSIIPVSLEDKHAILTINGASEKKGEGDWIDSEGKVFIKTITDDFVKINYEVNAAYASHPERLTLVLNNPKTKTDITFEVTSAPDTAKNKVSIKTTNEKTKTSVSGANPPTPIIRVYNLNDEIMMSDANNNVVKTGYYVKQIEKNSIIIEQSVNSAGTSISTSQSTVDLKEGDTYTFSQGLTATLNDIVIKKEAKISIQAEKDYGITKTNVTVRVGIEKRAIQLSPDKTKDIIKKLDDTINQWSKIRDGLRETSKVMKAACLITQTGLWIKYFVMNTFTSKGNALARKQVMEGWKVKCASEVGKGKEFLTYHACFMKYSDQIDKDVSNMQTNINNINTQIQNCKKKPGIVTTQKSSFTLFTFNLAGNEVINQTKFIEECLDFSKFSGLSEEEYTALVNYNYFGIDSVKNVYAMQKINDDCSSGKFSKDFCDANKKKYDSYIAQLKKQAEPILAEQTAAKLRKQDAGGVERPSIIVSSKDSTIVEVNVFNPTTNEITAFKELAKTDYITYITVDNIGYVLKLEKKNEYDYRIKNIYIEKDKTEITSGQVYGKIMSLTLRQKSEAAYRYEWKSTPEVKYWESGNNKGLPAIVPLGKYAKYGWYVATESSTVGKAYTDAGVLVSFSIGNVGENGIIEFEFPSKGDDIYQHFDYKTGQSLDSYAGLSSDEAKKLITEAQKVIAEAARQYGKAKNNKITIGTESYSVGAPATGTEGSLQCEDLMSPKDCHLLFNLCDPVMCPTSRCNLGGRYPVTNVKETGILGSILLCYPNKEEGIVVPICIEGLYAGLDNLIMVLNATRECLNTSLETGETVGICDQIKSFYLCDLFWRQMLPLLKVALPQVLNKVSGTSGGGGEYFTANEAITNLEESINFFTNEYGKSSFEAFRSRTTEEFGGDLCKMFFSSRVPGSQGFIDSLLEPESPTQFYAKFEEIEMNDAYNQPQSHYKVYYRIYAGRDNSVSYSVYLRNPPSQQYYTSQQTLQVPGAIGYISKGTLKDESPDFIGTSGYKEICVAINGREQCGFKEITTGFSFNELKDLYVSDQAKQKITTEAECISGTSSLRTFQLLDPNIQSTIQQAISPEIYKYGIVRICATEKPDSNVDAKRWEKVGTCGDERIGCWLDKKSLNNNTIKDLAILSNTEEYVADLFNELANTAYIPEADIQAKLSSAADSLNNLEKELAKLFNEYKIGTVKETTTTTQETAKTSKIDMSSEDFPSFFKFGVSTLTTQEKEILKKKIELIFAEFEQSQAEDMIIAIDGYASFEYESEAESNKQLAQNRANEVKKYIESLLELDVEIRDKISITSVSHDASNEFAISKYSAEEVNKELDRIKAITNSGDRKAAFASSKILAEDRRVIITLGYLSETTQETTVEKTDSKTKIEPKDVDADKLRTEITNILSKYNMPQQFDYIILNSLDDKYRAYAQLLKAELYDYITRNVYDLIVKIEAEEAAEKEAADATAADAAKKPTVTPPTSKGPSNLYLYNSEYFINKLLAKQTDFRHSIEMVSTILHMIYPDFNIISSDYSSPHEKFKTEIEKIAKKVYDPTSEMQDSILTLINKGAINKYDIFILKGFGIGGKNYAFFIDYDSSSQDIKLLIEPGSEAGVGGLPKYESISPSEVLEVYHIDNEQLVNNLQKFNKANPWDTNKIHELVFSKTKEYIKNLESFDYSSGFVSTALNYATNNRFGVFTGKDGFHYPSFALINAQLDLMSEVETKDFGKWLRIVLPPDNKDFVGLKAGDIVLLNDHTFGVVSRPVYLENGEIKGLSKSSSNLNIFDRTLNMFLPEDKEERTLGVIMRNKVSKKIGYYEVQKSKILSIYKFKTDTKYVTISSPQDTAVKKIEEYNYVFPVENPNSVTYGNCHHDYSATDIFGKVGEKLVAVTDGVLKTVDPEDDYSSKTKTDKCGKGISILGDDNKYYTYCHMDSVAAGLTVGQRISVGTYVGTLGKTGNAATTQAHLHFQIKYPGKSGTLQPGTKGNCQAGYMLGPIDFLNGIKS